MRVSVAAGSVLFLVVVAMAGACGGVGSAPQRTAQAPGELTSVRVDVHEAPG